MNVSRFILVVSLAWLTSIAVHYLVIKRFFPQQQSSVEQPITLVRDIDFSEQPSQEPVLTTIESDRAQWVFSSHGASLASMVYKKITDGTLVHLILYNQDQCASRDLHNFLVVLGDKTPFYYELKSVTQDDAKAVITYQARTKEVIIDKVFTIHKDSFEIELGLHISPLTSLENVPVRLLYAAPHVKELGRDEYTGAVIGDVKGSVEKIQRTSIALDKSWQPAFFGVEDKFFASILYKDSGFMNLAYYKLLGSQEVVAMVQSQPINKEMQWHMSFYVGPKDEKDLATVDSRLEGILEYSGILAPISKLLFKALNFINHYTHNYGWAIILLTLLINLLLLPLNIKSFKGMKKYNDFQKKLAYIKQRYKDDPETLKREQAELIAKHGLPGLGGCLPKLLQLPIFFALSRVLTNSIQLYKAPFILWIHDLSHYDPYYVLPGIIVISIIAQASTGDPKQKLMTVAMGLIFGAAAASFSAGLCLYILVGVVLNFVQMYVAQKLQWT